MKKLILTIVLMFSACAPSAQAVQTAIAQTQAAYTSTPDPIKLYIDALEPKMDDWRDAFGKFSLLHGKYADNPAIAQTNEFTNEIGVVTGDMMKVIDGFQELPQAPTKLKKLDTAVKQLEKSTKDFVPSYITAVLMNDETLMQISITPLQEMVDAVKVINQEIDKYK